jgi:hypothetical protein
VRLSSVNGTEVVDRKGNREIAREFAREGLNYFLGTLVPGFAVVGFTFGLLDQLSRCVLFGDVLM